MGPKILLDKETCERYARALEAMRLHVQEHGIQDIMPPRVTESWCRPEPFTTYRRWRSGRQQNRMDKQGVEPDGRLLEGL